MVARIETPQRWHAALRRSVENGIQLLMVNDTGERFATSSKNDGALYRVDTETCSCPAGVAGDPVCLHRAALRAALGWLAPEPVAPAEVTTRPACGACKGKGK